MAISSLFLPVVSNSCRNHKSNYPLQLCRFHSAPEAAWQCCLATRNQEFHVVDIKKKSFYISNTSRVYSFRVNTPEPNMAPLYKCDTDAELHAARQ